MRHVFQRLGLGISPGWAIGLLLVGLSVGAAFWVGPLRPLPPDLRLVAFQRDGTFTDSVDVSAIDAGGEPRFPLVLGAHNVGYASAQPSVLELNIPLSFRLVDRDGAPYPRETVPGNPLARYTLALSAPTLPPGGVPELLLDTLWLAPDLAAYTCAVESDAVLAFAPAPPVNAALMRRVDLFYSFRSDDTSARQAGLLRVRVDSSSLRRPVAVMGDPSPPTYTEPSTPLPDLGTLYQVSSTVVVCGEPHQPIALQSVVYATEAGARFIVLYHGGAPRKYLIDANGDSIIEHELWDPDQDGAFEAERTTRYAIPSFLFPRHVERALLAADSVPPDSAFLALFGDTASGPFRFARALRPPPDSAALAARAESTGLPPDLAVDAPVAADTVPPDTAWLRLYGDTAAGPFRFARDARQRADSLAAAIARGDTAPTEPPPEPTPRPRPGPRLLGTPVDSPPPPD